MRHRILFLLLTLSIVALSAPVAAADEGNCFSCHNEWEEGKDTPSKRWPADIHKDAGLTCSDCHGGDPSLDDMDAVRASKGYRGAPKATEIPGFCGRCHGDAAYMNKYNPSLPIDQWEKYKTSMHGMRLAKGDVKAATCISCHSVHNIAPANTPTSTVYAINIPKTCAACHANAAYMAGYNIPTDQYDKFAKSVHGVALLEKEDIGAPACNDCHGNHGALPPGIDDISAVCGLCHAKNAMLFDQSPHKQAFQEQNLPQCETCHSNHDIIKPMDAMIGTGPESLCSNCHSQGDGDKGYATAQAVSVMLDSLVKTEQKATDVIARAEQKGMSVTDQLFALKDVHSTLIESRTLIHSFTLEKIKPELDKGIQLGAAVYQQGLEILGEYSFRRTGLGVATILITFVALLIWLKIRRIER
ncbi:MAG: cytochrome c3 family protein [candidate division Zixibacteria bacterium]|nr:cytochrome c3 family protein [candidate division Zixibacteria bacterium]